MIFLLMLDHVLLLVIVMLFVGVFVSFVGLIVVAFAQLTQALQSDIFNIETDDEELF